MTKDITVDVAIIGTGTAGLSAFKEASKFTDKIILIDHGPLGTTCARVGCMPSKVLIQVADEFHARLHFKAIGIDGAENLSVSIPSVMKHVRKLRDYFTSGMIQYVESLGKKYIKGSASFVDANILLVDKQKIIAKSIIIAAGTSSIIPDAWKNFSDQILTSENIFEQKDFQKKIAVIGAGPIGLELGQALSRLGIEIAIFHSQHFIGGLTDPVVNDYAIKTFAKEFPLHLNALANVTKENHSLLVKTDKVTFTADQLLAAMGRQPNLAALNLKAIPDIKLDKTGLPLYNKTTMQIQHHPLFIAGDAGKFKPLLHEAADEGRITGFNAVQKHPHCFMRRTPLAIIFTEPNIATVGKRFSELKDEDFIIGETTFDDQGRARIMSQNKGILRVYVARQTGTLLGAEMIAPGGEHLAHILAAAIQQHLTVFKMLQMPFYHPVLEEGMRTALRDASAKVHDKKQKSFDLVMCESAAVGNLS